MTEEGVYDRWFAPAARWLLARGLRPNHLTFLQVPVFAAEIWAAWQGYRWLFIGLIVFVIALDGGDGILARVGGLQSRTGAMLDSLFDTMGIAVVLWGASLFFTPAATPWLLLLFLGNTMLYLQNALLEEKVIAYLRGPVLTAVAWPQALLAALVVASFVILWLLLWRGRRTWRALRHLDM